MPDRRKTAWLTGRAAGAGALAFSAATAHAQTGQASAPVIVVTAPGGAQSEAASVSRGDVYAAGSPDALASLTRNVAGVSLADAQGNPWQPNLSWRGFTASPLQGQAQGLAAYLDGGRFNLPFGDTVPFDVIPDAALSSLALVDASPVYGLNALGGAVVMRTATGFSDPGYVATAAYGRYDEREASLSGGGSKDRFSWFAAMQYRAEDGWRDYSPSQLFNGYLDFGYEGDGHGLHVKAVGADSDLTGNGVAPVELLQARRQSVFTHPDNSRTEYGRISLHPWLSLGRDTRLEGTLYYQRVRVRSLNGDAADIEPCEDDDLSGLLCLEEAGGGDDFGEDADLVLTGAGGTVLADTLDGGDYGLLNRGRVKTRSGGLLLQVADERAFLGGTNRLVMGISRDESRTRFATSAELGALTDDRSVEGLGSFVDQADGSIAPVGVIAHTGFTGIFASETLPLGKRLSLRLDLRWNHARIRLDDQIGTALNGDHRFRRLNPGAELRYDLPSGLALVAGYAETNRTPTPAELSCADEDAPCSLANFFVADPPLEQVVARTWKASASVEGSTGAWRIGWHAGIWRTVNANDIQHVASAIRGRAYFRNVGSTRRQGGDIAIDARRGAFSVSASYAFLDATFRDPVILSSPSNPLAGADGTINVAKGDRLSSLPRHSAVITAGWDAGGLSFAADLVAKSGQQLVGDEAGQTPHLPGHLIANLRASGALTPGFSVFGEVRNVTGKKYATFGTFSEVDEVELAEVPGANDPRAYGPGAPRRWSVGIKARF